MIAYVNTYKAAKFQKSLLQIKLSYQIGITHLENHAEKRLLGAHPINSRRVREKGRNRDGLRAREGWPESDQTDLHGGRTTDADLFIGRDTPLEKGARIFECD